MISYEAAVLPCIFKRVEVFLQQKIQSSCSDLLKGTLKANYFSMNRKNIGSINIATPFSTAAGSKETKANSFKSGKIASGELGEQPLLLPLDSTIQRNSAETTKVNSINADSITLLLKTKILESFAVIIQGNCGFSTTVRLLSLGVNTILDSLLIAILSGKMKFSEKGVAQLFSDIYILVDWVTEVKLQVTLQYGASVLFPLIQDLAPWQRANQVLNILLTGEIDRIDDGQQLSPSLKMTKVPPEKRIPTDENSNVTNMLLSKHGSSVRPSSDRKEFPTAADSSRFSERLGGFASKFITAVRTGSSIRTTGSPPSTAGTGGGLLNQQSNRDDAKADRTASSPILRPINTTSSPIDASIETSTRHELFSLPRYGYRRQQTQSRKGSEAIEYGSPQQSATRRYFNNGVAMGNVSAISRESTGDYFILPSKEAAGWQELAAVHRRTYGYGGFAARLFSAERGALHIPMLLSDHKKHVSVGVTLFLDTSKL
jgi:hypothetical protein